MSIALRLSAPPPGPESKKFCTIGRLLVDYLNNEDRGVLVSALADPHWPSVAIQRVLAEEGYRVSERHLRAHRRGDHTETQCHAHDLGLVR